MAKRSDALANARWLNMAAKEVERGTVFSLSRHDIPRLNEIAELLKRHHELLQAADRVLTGLNGRIQHASKYNPHSVPVYDGIAELHAAIYRPK